MSFNVFAAPLRLDLKPARQRRAWRWLTHLAALTTLPLLQSPWLMVVVVAIVLVSLYRTHSASRLTLLWSSDDHWTLFEDGRGVTARLAGPAFVQVWLVILPLRLDASRVLRHIAVFPDEVPEQIFRRLRVRLRTSQGIEAAVDDTQP